MLSIANEVVRFWQRVVCPLLLVLFCWWAGWASRGLVHAVHEGRRRAELSGASGVIRCLERSVPVVAADAAGSVEDGVRAVGIDVRLDPRVHEMGPHRPPDRSPGVQRPVGDAIVLADLPLLLDAQDLVESDARDRREGRALAGRLNPKAGVVGGQIAVADEGVGRLDSS